MIFLRLLTKQEETQQEMSSWLSWIGYANHRGDQPTNATSPKINKDSKTQFLKQGLLGKQGDYVKSWKTRYFILRYNYEHNSCALVYYRKQQAIIGNRSSSSQGNTNSKGITMDDDNEEQEREQATVASTLSSTSSSSSSTTATTPISSGSSSSIVSRRKESSPEDEKYMIDALPRGTIDMFRVLYIGLLLDRKLLNNMNKNMNLDNNGGSSGSNDSEDASDHHQFIHDLFERESGDESDEDEDDGVNQFSTFSDPAQHHATASSLPPTAITGKERDRALSIGRNALHVDRLMTMTNDDTGTSSSSMSCSMSDRGRSNSTCSGRSRSNSLSSTIVDNQFEFVIVYQKSKQQQQEKEEKNDAKRSKAPKKHEKAHEKNGGGDHHHEQQRYHIQVLRANSEQERADWINVLIAAKQTVKRACQSSELEYSNINNDTWNMISSYMPNYSWYGRTSSHDKTKERHEQTRDNLSFDVQANIFSSRFMFPVRTRAGSGTVVSIDQIQIENVKRMMNVLYEKIRNELENDESNIDIILINDSIEQMKHIVREYKKVLVIIGDVVPKYLSKSELCSLFDDNERLINRVNGMVKDKVMGGKFEQFAEDFMNALKGCEQIMESEPEYIVCSLEHALEQINDPKNEFRDLEQFTSFQQDYNRLANDLITRSRLVLYSNYLDRVLDRMTCDVEWAEQSTLQSEIDLKLKSVTHILNAIYETKPELRDSNHEYKERIDNLWQRVMALEQKFEKS